MTIHAESPSAPTGEVIVNVFGRTDVGRTREHNEDAFLVVDLTAVPFMDSTDFNALLEGHRAGATIAVRGAGGAVRRLLELVAVPGIIDVED